jgi:hypothetical protein
MKIMKNFITMPNIQKNYRAFIESVKVQKQSLGPGSDGFTEADLFEG